jgi:hypothetical protein
MVSRLEEVNSHILIYVCVAWLVAAERSDERNVVYHQVDQRHSKADASEMLDGKPNLVDVREHPPRFLKLSERGGKTDEDLRFAPQTVHSEECSAETVTVGEEEVADAVTRVKTKRPKTVTEDAAVLHCCGTENVVGWHQHLKEKARDLAKHGLQITEPHEHRAQSINLQKNMEMNEYMSLVVGCDYCKCPEDLAKAAIDLHKQTSQANNDYLDNMLHGGAHLVHEYNHMAHLSNIFRLMSNNMSIRGTIDSAIHAIDLSQEVARITKHYKDRMQIMSKGGHAFMKNLTELSENPAYQVYRPKVVDYFEKEGNKPPGRQVDFRSLRTNVERMGVLSERPDVKYKYYKIVPTELREYHGKRAKVGSWALQAQDGENFIAGGQEKWKHIPPAKKKDIFDCERDGSAEKMIAGDAYNQDFSSILFSFCRDREEEEDERRAEGELCIPQKLGKVGYITSDDARKDILRFTLLGSNDKKNWKRIFNGVATPPTDPHGTRPAGAEVWVDVTYNELAPESEVHGTSGALANVYAMPHVVDLENVMAHFPPVSLLSDQVEGPTKRTIYLQDLSKLKYWAIAEDAIDKMGSRNMHAKGYALGQSHRGLAQDMEDANLIFEEMIGFHEDKDCGKLENEICFAGSNEEERSEAGSVFLHGLLKSHRQFFEWLFDQWKSWLGENVLTILDAMPQPEDAKSRESLMSCLLHLEMLVTGFYWQKAPAAMKEIYDALAIEDWFAQVPLEKKLALVDTIAAEAPELSQPSAAKIKKWLLRQERVFVHKEVSKLCYKEAYEGGHESEDVLPPFREYDNQLFANTLLDGTITAIGDYANYRKDTFMLKEGNRTREVVPVDLVNKILNGCREKPVVQSRYRNMVAKFEELA